VHLGETIRGVHQLTTAGVYGSWLIRIRMQP
jgi:hypothetical protein